MIRRRHRAGDGGVPCVARNGERPLLPRLLSHGGFTRRHHDCSPRPSGTSNSAREGDREGPHGRPGRSAQAEGGAEEGEFVHLLSGQLLEHQDLDDDDADDREQVAVNGQVAVRIGRRELFQGDVVATDRDALTLLGEVLRALDVQPRLVDQVLVVIRSESACDPSEA